MEQKLLFRCLHNFTKLATGNWQKTYFVPANPDMKILSQSLIDARKLKKVMDETGKTYPLVPTKVGGTESFEKNGSIFVTVTASGLPSAQINQGSDHLKCFPNPFSDELTIEIRFQDPKELEVSVYDLNGKLIVSNRSCTSCLVLI